MTFNYIKVSYLDNNYAVIQIKIFISVIDYEDLEKVLEYEKWTINNTTEYMTCKRKDLEKIPLGIHNLLMDRLIPTGKGAIESVDHINRCPRDNRKINLRIVSQTIQNYNTKKRERKVILPEGCGIEPNEIPIGIWYSKAHGNHGDSFVIEIKGLPEGTITYKSTKSKNVSLRDKLEDTKLKLANIYENYPILQEERTNVGIIKRNQLRQSFNDILLLSIPYFQENIIQNNLLNMEELLEQTHTENAVKLVSNYGCGKTRL